MKQGLMRSLPSRPPTRRFGRARIPALTLLKTAARRPRGRVSLAIVAFVVAVAVVGPFVAPHSPSAFVTVSYASPSSRAILGGDQLGRDVLSRVLDGGWVLLLLALAATLFGVALGTLLGVTAAYVRGHVDGLIMRAVDVILAFPQLVFALLLVSIAGPKLWLIVIAVGLTHAPQVARVLHAATLDVSERQFVKAAELTGASRRKVILREIVPNLSTPLMVETGLRLTWSIVIIAGLSFLGFGQQPPAPNWGVMINENRAGLYNNPWPVIVPAMLIALLAVGTNTFTDVVSSVSLGEERTAVRNQPLAGVTSSQ